LKNEDLEGFIARATTFSLVPNSDNEQPDPPSKSWEPSSISLWLTGRYLSMQESFMAKVFKVKNMESVQRIAGFVNLQAFTECQWYTGE
jgi:hypothetical protein